MLLLLFLLVVRFALPKQDGRSRDPTYISRCLNFDLTAYLSVWYAILPAPMADAPYGAALSKY